MAKSAGKIAQSIVSFIPIIGPAVNGVLNAKRAKADARVAAVRANQATQFALNAAKRKAREDLMRRAGMAKASVASRGFIGSENDTNDILGNIIEQLRRGNKSTERLLDADARKSFMATQNQLMRENTAAQDMMLGGFVQAGRDLVGLPSVSKRVNNFIDSGLSKTSKLVEDGLR